MDDEAVKTLKRIEVFLGKAFPSGSNKGASAGTSDRSTKDASSKDKKKNNDKDVKDLSKAAKKAGADLLDLSQNAKDLSSPIKKSSKGLLALALNLKDLSSPIKKASKGILAVSKNFDTLEDVCKGASKSLAKMVKRTDKAGSSLSVFSRSTGHSTRKLNTFTASLVPITPPSPPTTTPLPPPATPPTPANPKPAPKKGSDDAALAEFQAGLQKINKGVLAILDDAFDTLAARGYGASDSLTSLYTSSIGVNMRLQEYAQLMDKNMIAVSRASSFAEFQKNLRTGTDSLRKFGVFGADAANLSATMMSASTSLGVPQAQLGEAMGKQVDVFEKLRKTVGVTAKGFQELVAELSSNTQTVTELSALAPQERASRQAQLLEQMAYAQALGLSEAEQKRYTASVLAQRQTTVKKRFELAGRLTQAAGLTGMSAGKTDELRTLAGKKYKTKDEQTRYMQLMGELNTKFEQMQQSGRISSQYMADTITEAIGAAGGKEALDSAAVIRAAKESGEQRNTDLGKTLGPLGVAIGSAMTLLGGLGKNPAVEMVGGIVSAIVSIAIPQGMVIGKIVAAAITAAMSRFGGGPGGPGTPPGPGGRWGLNGPGKLKTGLRVATRVGGIAAGAIGVGIAANDYANAEETAAAGDGDVGKAKGEAIGEGIGSAVGTAIGFGLAGFTGGLSVALIPIITPLTGGLGKLVGAMIGSEDATEKNTKELIKATREKAGETTVSANNLGSLGANVAASARAYAPPNEAELKKHAESKMTAAQIVASRAKEAKEAKNRPVVKAEPVKAEPVKAEPVKTTPVQATPVVKAEPVVTPVQALTPILATPATQVPSGVKPVEINKPVVQEPSPVKSTLEAGTPALPVQDPGSVLSQILAILQQSLVAENLQVDLTGQLLRARALMPSLPDNQRMVKSVFAET